MSQPVAAPAPFKALDTTSVLRPARLSCPQCGPRCILKARTIESIDFYGCGLCGGVWFYHRELDAALDALAQENWTPNIQPQPNELPEPAACPCCDGRLVSVHDRRGSGAIVHRCLVCYGGWLQNDDVLKVAAEHCGLLSQLGRSIRRLWLA